MESTLAITQKLTAAEKEELAGKVADAVIEAARKIEWFNEYHAGCVRHNAVLFGARRQPRWLSAIQIASNATDKAIAEIANFVNLTSGMKGSLRNAGMASVTWEVK